MTISEVRTIKLYDWLPMQEINEDLFNLFKTKLEELAVCLLRADTRQDAEQLILNEALKRGIRDIVTAPLTLLNVNDLQKKVQSADISFSAQVDISQFKHMQMGISQFDLGIASLGCIFQQTACVQARLVSMLPPIHLVILSTFALVHSFDDALEVIVNANEGKIPSHLSFITGPSRGADIDADCCLGIHGAEKLIILCVDER